MSNHQTILSFDAVSRIYRQGPTEVRAVDDLSFSVEAGEFTALCGPSGSGKSTTLNLIGGLDAPSSGHIYLEGRDLSRLGGAELARLRRDRIGFVFQSYNLIEVLTAFENAEFVLALQGRSVEARTEIANAVLAQVGLSGLERRRPDQLSGGQQQRVAIARAIAPQPALVLADEPTANVDSDTAEALLDLMETLNRDHGTTFIFSTHDERVMRRARRVVTLRDGRVVSDETRAKA